MSCEMSLFDRSKGVRSRRRGVGVWPAILAGTFGLLATQVAIADIRLPNNQIPRKADLVIQLGSDGDPLPVRVLCSGLKARELPEPLGSDNPETGRELGYLSVYMTVREHEPTSGGGKFYLLVKSIKVGDVYQVDRVLGWVHSKYLLTTEHALQEPITKLYQKAMVVNSIDEIAKDLERVKKDTDARFGAVAPRTAPSPTGPAAGEDIRLFNLFFIYGRADGYTLVGRSPVMPTYDPSKDDEEAKNIVVGWLPESRVCDWLTREALYWNPEPARDQPGTVFSSPAEALKSLRTRDGATVTSELPAKPNQATFGRKLSAIQMRFPILAWDGDRNTPRKVQNNEMIRIGAFGDFLTSNVAGEVQPGLKEEQLAAMQVQLTRIQREARRVELAFVIDETLSMKIWFPVVKTTIETIINDVRAAASRRSDTDVRISISYYADTFKGAEPAKPGNLLPATSAEFAEALRELADHQEIDGGDLDERVFHGLGQAIDKAEFSKFSRKMVFLFGDFGSKEEAGDPTLPDLIDKLVPVDPNTFPVEFYAVQMGNVAGDPEVVESAGKFKSQMTTLSQRVSKAIKDKSPNDPDAGTLSRFSTVVNPEDAAPLIKDVVDRFSALRRKANEISDQIDKLRLTFGNPISPDTERALRGRGVPIDELRKLKGAQLFQPGYVWTNNAKNDKQIRNYILLSEKEIDTFLTLTDGLDKLPDEVGYLTVAAFLKRLVGLEVGELDRDMTAAEVMKKYSGFQIKQPSLFTKLKDLNNATLNAQERADIRWKRAILTDIRNAQRSQFVVQEIKRAGGFQINEHVKAAQKPVYEPRSFYFPGDPRVKWYWIDFEEEWP